MLDESIGILVELPEPDYHLLARLAEADDRSPREMARRLLRRLLQDLAADRPGTEPEEKEAGDAA